MKVARALAYRKPLPSPVLRSVEFVAQIMPMDPVTVELSSPRLQSTKAD